MSFIIALALVGAAGTIPDPVVGVWVNPKGSLQVRTRRCGNELCGAVVGASAKTMAKAQAAGIANLIGTELFSGYRQDNDGDWAGTLFIPDRGKHVSSTIETDRGRTLKISGCLIGRFFCRSQVWTRVEGR